MKINFDTTIKTLDGEEIKNESNKVFTLKDTAITALMATYEDEKNLSGQQKLDRYVLACKIRTGGECELKVEDITLLKTLVGKAFSPLVVGQAWELLEG